MLLCTIIIFLKCSAQPKRILVFETNVKNIPELSSINNVAVLPLESNLYSQYQYMFYNLIESTLSQHGRFDTCERYRVYDLFGEKQRVMIASALAQEPEIILLDEPTSALDLHHQIGIYQILKELQKSQNLTIIVVTHDINLAAQFCNRMILMHKGEIIGDGNPDEVLKFQILQDIFGVKVYIDINPMTNSLYILPYK